MNKWFKDNLLPMNLDTTHWLQFSTRKNFNHDIQIAYIDMHIL